MERMTPGKEDQKRVVSIDLLREMAEDESCHALFLQHCCEFLGEYQEGDIVLEFCSSKQSWNQGMGRAGYILLRDGKAIAFLGTAMN